MSLTAFLHDLTQKGLELWAQDDRLRFRAPDGLLDRAAMERIKANKAAILKLLQEDPGAINGFPLSRGQRALWFTYRLDPSSPAYNLVTAMRLDPKVDLEMLQTALDLVTARHEMLRMTFALRGEEPIQIRHGGRSVTMTVDPIQADEHIVTEWIRKHAEAPFDLAQETPLRAALGQQPNGGKCIIFTLHHIAGDLHAFERIILEWASVCAALHQGREPVLPEPGRSFLDWVAEEQAWLAGPEGERAKTFWLDTLAGALPVMDLPADRPRPALQTFHGQTHAHFLPASYLQPLVELAKSVGATPYAAMVTVFQVLLARYTNQRDMLVGIPVSQRSNPEFGTTVGYLVNPLVLRGQIDGSGLFKETLKKTRFALLDALEHANFPFADLVAALDVRRDPSRSPLFQTAFVWEQHQAGGLDRSALPWPFQDLIEAGQRGSEFDLTLTATQSHEGLHCKWRFNPDLFDTETIQRLAGAFGRLLTTLPQHPGTPLAVQNDWLTQENAYWSQYWVGPQPASTEPDALASWLTRMDLSAPESTALTTMGASKDDGLNYRELKTRAAQLAHRIQAQALPLETPVAILCGRNQDMVVAMLAAIWSGHPYIPMDPNFPESRLRDMIEDGQPGLLLTQSPLTCPVNGIQRLNLDECSWDGPRSESPQYLPSSQLAYIIYTSGSTGKPKGVQVSRGALANFLNSMQNRLQLGPEHVFLAVTTISFDIAALELFLPLMQGSHLVLADRETAQDASALADRLTSHRVSHMQATPATWRMLTDGGWRGDGQLTVLCGGEALPENLAAVLKRCGRSVWNLYGPTETTIWSAARELSTDGHATETVTIGGPLDHTQIYVTSGNFQRQPVGVPGELVIAGDGLARGYRNQPGKTAAQFVPNPFGPPGSRAYRTGDLVRAQPQGELWFLGRIDHQVKVRGYRIELGDIENALRSHPRVREAVVLAYRETDVSLAAYLDFGSEPEVPIEALRDHLLEQLPAYMVPHAFVVMDRFPLTPNGKINRRALPKPQSAGDATPFSAPRNAMEAKVLGIWRNVLGKNDLGIEHDFFLAGGHSLNATRIAAQIASQFQVAMASRLVFKARTVANLSAMIAEANPDTGQRPKRTDTAPLLSPGQERLWFLDQLEGQGGAYLMAGAFRLEGALDAAALTKAFTSIEARHQVLRTGIETRAGKPFAFLLETSERPLPTIDLSELEPAARERSWHVLASMDARTGFNLAAPPLWRARLLRLTDQCHILLINLHHIAADGQSIGVFLRELSHFYRHEIEKISDVPPKLIAQFSDFAHEQRVLNDEVDRSASWQFWQAHLANAPTCLELPTDRARPATPSHAGGEVHFRLNPDWVRAFRQWCGGRGATLYAGLHTLFAAMLGRYAGCQDVVIGVPTANRERSEWRPLIGLFVNTLALRTRWTGQPSFASLLDRVQKDLLAAQQHQDMPFDQLVDRLQPDRNLSHSPIFQVMMTLQERSGNHIDLPGIRASWLPKAQVTAKYDLSLYLAEVDGAIEATLEFSRDLFDAPRIHTMAEHFCMLAEAALAQPDAPLTEMALQTTAERRFWLEDWNDTRRPLPFQPLADHLRLRAENHPNRIALGGVRPITYAKLDNAVDALAFKLQASGARREWPVGICLDRGPDLLVALLAVLRAGAAYVPLDPKFPEERLGYLLNAADIQLLLTQTGLEKQLPAHPAKKLLVDGCAQESSSGEKPVEVQILPDQLAYTIFTSGSTGNPKGVQVGHGALMNFLESMRLNPGFKEEDHLLAVTTVSFDIAALELYLPLLAGGRLTIAEGETTGDAVQLAQCLDAHAISVMQATPATWRMLRLTGWKRPIRVWCGGEALSGDLAQGLLDDGHTLWNLYGPTETTIWSGCCQVQPELLSQGHTPVGGPIANTSFYVLDQRYRPVPIGTPGQLFIGGDGLARGYQNMAGRTARQFLPDPFATKPGLRLYATGDLVRQREHDGGRYLEFLGRIDLQIKLRGFRIELGDIESHLNRHPEVDQAIALVRQTAGGDGQLIAFLKTKAKCDWQTWLQDKLPSYMIPARFFECDAFPMTPNGKVNRGELSKRAGQENTKPQNQAPPATETELKLAEIWSGLLEIGNIGRNQSFFRLGGHSLLATQMLARVADQFGKQVPLSTLFNAPALCEFASILDGTREEGPLESHVRADRNQPVPLSSAQKRLWFLQQIDLASGAYNMPGGLRLRGALDRAALEKALQKVVDRHEPLHTVFKTVAGDVQAECLPNWNLPLEFQTLTNEPNPEACLQDHRIREAKAPFNLATPLVRARLLQIAEDDHVLLVTLHHLLADEWSLQVFIADLAVAYQACKTGQVPEWQALPLQYADVAAAQSRRDFSTERAYWLETLSGAPSSIALPTCKPYPKVQTFEGNEVTFHLDQHLTNRLEALCRSEGATLFMGLFSAFAILLYKHTGQERFVIGSQIANRNRRDYEPMIGLFTNTLGLLAELGDNPTPTTLLARVKQTSLAGMQHGGMPFEEVIEALNPERQLARNPLFQVAINLLNTPKPLAEMAGLAVDLLPQPRLFSKVELSLEMKPSDDGLRCSFEYNKDLFLPETVMAWSKRFITLIEAMIEAPHQPIGTLAMLSEREIRRLTRSWNATDTVWEDESFIREFEKQAMQHPTRQAVYAEGTWLTYGELNQRANALALRLRREGATRETLVGICCGRGHHMLVALLAVQKAGSAYVPIDPDYPADRVAYMMADAQLPLLLTESARQDQMPAHTCHTIFLEDAALEAAPQGPAATLHPDQLAYVIYTSGSTNKPKGVQLSQKNLANFLQSMANTPGLTEADTLLAVTTLSFDIAGLELYLPLMVGGKLVIADRAATLDGGLLAQMIQSLGVTAMQATPSSWRLLEAAGFKGPLKRLCGGEALPPDLAASLLEHPGELWNMYGPTETTIWSATRQVLPAWRNQAKRLTAVAGPIANTQLYVLDPSLQLVPPGTPGQLFIGGTGLARGYRGRPDLTAKSFVPNPFRAHSAECSRLYATGDLVRLIPPAPGETMPEFEFLGRLDHQIKIRGFRVELGEIETALSKHPGIEQTVASVTANPGQRPRLIAYFVARPQSSGPDAAALRQFLSHALPAYMMPEQFIRLAAMPQTPNGKIDRKALPEPDTLAPNSEETKAPLHNDWERQVAEVWQTILGIEAIGSHDNFFDLGGTSFLLMQVRTQLVAKTQVELSVIDLLEHTSVSALAAWLESRAQPVGAGIAVSERREDELLARQAKRDARRQQNQRHRRRMS